MSASVQGVKAIQLNIKAHKLATAKGLRKGLLRGGLFLQRESQKIVPVDTNVLRSSASTRAIGLGFNTVVAVGYGTDYGVFVHEDLEARHKPGKQAKFLEQPARKKAPRINAIVAESIVRGQ